MKGKIFNMQEVQAIISGNKKMFREIIKPQPSDQQKHISKTTFSQNKEEIGKVFLTNHDFSDLLSRRSGEKRIECPYKVREKIFCKEDFFANKNHNNLVSKDLPVDSLIMYAAGGGANVYDKKRPAQHMKQEHSRLTLQIKEIKVEKLSEISEEDAIAEGVEIGVANGEQCGFKDYLVKNLILADAKDSFKTFWNATHKKPEEKFEANLFVWCVSFEIINN